MDDQRKKDDHGEWRLMTKCQGYVMARRPGAAPMVFSAREWEAKASPEEYDALTAAWNAHDPSRSVPSPPLREE
jgi:hypothetical protein